LREVTAVRHKPADSNHCLGRALLLERQLPEAIRHLKVATDLDPKRPEYHMYLGWAANEAGRMDEAEFELRRALELDQGLADAYWQRGALRRKQGALSDAIRDLTRALDLRPSRHEAHAELADAYFDSGRDALALLEWEKAVSAIPDVPVWHFRYGKVLLGALRRAEAAAHLEKSIALSANDGEPPSWLNQAHLYSARAHRSGPQAVDHWKAFLKGAPADSPYIAEAESALKQLGHPVR
jgi:tetratricopeptide (TPR) repeat protein